MLERNLKVIAGAVFLVSILFVSGILLQTIREPKVLPTVFFEEIDQGYYCGIKVRIEYVIDDNESWGSLWEDIHNTSTGYPDLPFVNFSKQVIIAVFIGEFPTGGYSATIKRIEATFAGLKVHVDEVHPGEGCGVTMAFTQPYHIVIAEIDSSRSIEFIYYLIIQPCI